MSIVPTKTCKNPTMDAQIRVDGCAARMRQSLIFSCTRRGVPGYAEKAFLYIAPGAGIWAAKYLMDRKRLES